MPVSREEDPEVLERCVDFARGVAEGDCAYGDACPSNAGTRHGACDPCKAREALGLPPSVEGAYGSGGA